jgi:STE24 endopeptidase
VSSQTILVLFLVFFAVDLVWDTALTVLNLRHVRRHASSVPAPFVGVVDQQTWERSVAYTIAHGRLGLLRGAVTSAAVLAAVLSGFLGLLDGAARSLPLHPSVQGLVFLGIVAALLWVLGLPFSLYATFSVEQKFGFNRQTPALYIIDTLKGLALSLLIGIPVLLALFWFMDSTGRFWWIWAFGAMTVFELVMNVLSPLVIAPLFNRFTPLPEGMLRDSIEALSKKLGFRTRGIFVVDSSRRSRHSNAYFTGLGSAKRIVLFDTLVSSNTDAEILSVLAHEIGHEKRNHVRKGLAGSIVMSLLGFWILSLLLRWTPLYAAFSFSAPSYQALLVLIGLCAGPFTIFLQPLFSMRSRKQEYEADLFAVRGIGSAAGLRSALLRLSRENLSNLAPHPLYSFFHYSHPTLAERIAAMEKAEKALAPQSS